MDFSWFTVWRGNTFKIKEKIKSLSVDVEYDRTYKAWVVPPLLSAEKIEDAERLMESEGVEVTPMETFTKERYDAGSESK